LFTCEEKLLNECEGVLTEILSAADIESPMQEIVCLAFETDYLKEISFLKEKINTWQKGMELEN